MARLELGGSQDRDAEELFEKGSLLFVVVFLALIRAATRFLHDFEHDAIICKPSAARQTASELGEQVEQALGRWPKPFGFLDGRALVGREVLPTFHHNRFPVHLKRERFSGVGRRGRSAWPLWEHS
jgi:hypothetical protein